MSTVAALAVASPVAVIAVSELSGAPGGPASAPQHRQFVQAALVTDLPGELISALSQGLSQFGVNLPPLPTGLLTGSGPSTPATVISPGLTAPGLTTPALTTPGLTAPAVTTPGLTTPAAIVTPAVTATGPALTDPALTNPALTNPALTSPTGATPALTTPGLTTPAAVVTPAAITPVSTPGLPASPEVPISAPIGLDPAVGTSYPILGDPSLAAAPAASSGGLIGDLSSAANQLGAGQAIDLLKGVLMPAIMSAVKPGAGAAPLPVAPPPPPVPGA